MKIDVNNITAIRDDRGAANQSGGRSPISRSVKRRWSFEKDRRDQRNIWHYVANAFSLCVDRIAPGATPLGPPPIVNYWFDPLAPSMPTQGSVNARFDSRFR
jgi:hypothetical protein